MIDIEFKEEIFIDIFWSFYSLNKDAKKFQEVFIPPNECEILKRFN
ncbi:hypothetical protein [Prochlorococcus marinus]|nr:hypothetical protein [Prochlorococcus marinus]